MFGYYEQLLQLADVPKVDAEIIRIRNFNESLQLAGYDVSLMEMFVDSAIDLLVKVRDAVQRQDDDDAFLLEAMNNESESPSIVFCFKARSHAHRPLRVPGRFQCRSQSWR